MMQRTGLLVLSLSFAAACGGVEDPTTTDPAQGDNTAATADANQVILNGSNRQDANFNISGTGVIGGKLAIGAAKPDYDLHVASSALTGAQQALQSANDDANGASTLLLDKMRGTSAAPTDTLTKDGIFSLIGRAYSQGKLRAATQIGAVVDGAPNDSAVPGALTFATSDNSALHERVRITSSGNVGIGTADPAYALDVNGSVRVAGLVPFVKGGNNGTASCDTYCQDPSNQWGASGVCVGGGKITEGDYSGRYIGCDTIATSITGALTGVVCACAAIP